MGGESLTIYRLEPATGQKRHAIRDAAGFLVLGAPYHGAEKHHAKNAVRVSGEREAAILIAAGYSIRVEGLDAGGPGLVSQHLYFEGKLIR